MILSPESFIIIITKKTHPRPAIDPLSVQGRQEAEKEQRLVDSKKFRHLHAAT